MIAIGKIGIWFAHNAMSIAESVAFAQKVEACGYGALESLRRSDTSRLYISPLSPVRPLRSSWPLALRNLGARCRDHGGSAEEALVEISGNRFLLGLGVSHAPL